MPLFAPPLLLTLLLATAPAVLPPPANLQSARGIELAQLTIEQRVIIRIPIVPPTAPSPDLPPDARGAGLAPLPQPEPPQVPTMKEVKGPKCLRLNRLRGAVISMASGITMVTDKNEHFRAHFSRMCRAASFYQGFYIQPDKDGHLCAGRDVLHARNGSVCAIERFSRLVPGR